MIHSTQFILQHYNQALISEATTGISAIFILAQAALESGWGKHAPGNMYFGIKAAYNTPQNEKQLLTTYEYLHGKRIKVKAWFRSYGSSEESFTHHAQLLSSAPRYRNAMMYKDDPLTFAKAIADAGYATNPNYAKSLQQVIRQIQQVISNFQL